MTRTNFRTEVPLGREGEGKDKVTINFIHIKEESKANTAKC